MIVDSSDGGDIPITPTEPRSVGPAVVVVPSIFGVDEDLRDHLERFEAAGALGVAFDPFWRSEPGPRPYTDFEGALARALAVPPAKVEDDLVRVIDWARDRGNGRVITLGICYGGRFALRSAYTAEADAVVTWHGSRMAAEAGSADRITCPLQLHFGAADALVPMSDVELIRTAFASRDNVEIVVHDGAAHGFSMPSSPAYQRQAADAATAGMRTLIDSLR